MADIDVLETVLDQTAGLLDGVTPESQERPTPCPEYDVRALVNHITGWVQSFAEGANGRTFEGDPSAHEASDDPGGEFRAAAATLVAGWREHGTDRTVQLVGADLPAEMVLHMTVMEYLAHGWDLAKATGQPVPFSDDDATAALEAAQGTLPPEYRGEGKPFGNIVVIPDASPSIDRFAAFMGRDPNWNPS